ncbi:phage tail protein [Clostridium beijerinckii]|uniref:phage tail protein n=1 Tax=Clostridium beijerinckii TaxID=1520 RepID=UPI001494430A|nr:phage tail protein [Clostridium beijerinckii]NOW05013.1 hypothetical protein [Clostridium beijerinckii]NYC01845.1 hypothetical protein [Clostridium beijerinckii]
MATKNIEIQDSTGNIYYPHTDAAIVKFGDSNVNSTLLDLVKNISNDVILTPSMNYGMNNVIKNDSKTSASPSFTIQGKTVVNLLGKDGNCEDSNKWWPYQANLSNDSTNKVFGNNSIKITLTSTTGCLDNLLSKYNIDITKYYLISAYLKNGNATNIVLNKDAQGGGVSINSATVTSTTNFTRVGLVVKPSDLSNGNYFQALVTGASGQYAYVDGIMINEITASEYALGTNALLDNYPYVDSYSCLQNPYIEVRHDNLVRNGNGEEGIYWWIPYDISKVSLTLENGRFKLVDTNSTGKEFCYQKIKVKPNTNYYIYYNVSGTGMILVNTGVGTTSLYSGTSRGTFNSGQNSEIQISMYNYSTLATTIYFDSIMLVEGTTSPSTYKSCRIERAVLETKLTSDDSITYKNGEITGQIWWKHKTLFGKDCDINAIGDYTGFKSMQISLQEVITDMSRTLVEYDGKILKNDLWANTYSSGDMCGTSTNLLSISVSDTDTGWAETIAPNVDEVKAFMNGWKAADYFSTTNRYCAWQSVIDNSFPSATIQTTATATSTGTTATIASAVFSAGDSINVFNSAGIRKGACSVASASGNTLTLTSSANISNGDILVKNDSNIVNYCKNNIAPGYEGYQLHYKLQVPEFINDNNCIIHGDVPLFDVGDNYLYLDNGIVLNEITTPVLGNGAFYYWNHLSYPKSLFKYPNEYISSIYLNNIFNNKMMGVKGITSNSYGNERWSANSTDVDINSIYTVDYKILSTIAPQIGTISCNYSQDINSAISNIQESLNSKQVHDSIFDQIVDASLYETISIYLEMMSWTQTSSGLYSQIVVNIMPKKRIPTITFNNYKIYVGGTDTTVKTKIDSLSIKNNRIIFTVCITESTVITNVKSNGINVTADIIVDCRGRI